MTEHITGLVTTREVSDWHETTVGWTMPNVDNADAFVRAATKRFEKELRTVIGEHQDEA